jgi:aspartate aminotransferase-like enzyme
MVPGPTELSKNVINKLNHQIVPHYGEEWIKTYKNTKRLLKKIYKTKNEVFIFAGSGSLAMESAISSTLSMNDEVLICHNGFWGERLHEICKSWKLKINVLKCAFNKPISPDEVDKKLRDNNKIKLVLIVHVETSTGLSNPIREIGKIIKKHNALFFVDSIAGVGGSNICTDKWNIDFVVTSSQKCLAAPAGLGLMSVSKKALKIIKKKSVKNQYGWSININNLIEYQKKWKEWHPHGPTTAPVSIYLALNVSISNILYEGQNNVLKRHILIKRYVRNEIRNLGLELFAKEENYAANTLTTFLLPKKINANKFIAYVKKNYSITLSGDLGYVDKRLIRIGHMGNQARSLYAKKTILAIKKTLKANL